MIAHFFTIYISCHIHAISVKMLTRLFFYIMIRIKASQRKNQREFFTAKAQRREENTSNSHSLRLGVSAFFLAPTWLAFMRFIVFIMVHLKIIHITLLSPAFRKLLKLGGLRRRRLIRPISPKDGVDTRNAPGWRAFSGTRKPAFILQLSLVYRVSHLYT